MYNQLSLIQPLKDKMNEHYILKEDSIPTSKEHSVLPDDQSVHANVGKQPLFVVKNHTNFIKRFVGKMQNF